MLHRAFAICWLWHNYIICRKWVHTITYLLEEEYIAVHLDSTACVALDNVMWLDFDQWLKFRPGPLSWLILLSSLAGPLVMSGNEARSSALSKIETLNKFY